MNRNYNYKKTFKINGKEFSTNSVSSLDFSKNIKYILNYLKNKTPKNEIEINNILNGSIVEHNSININKLTACYFLCEKLYGYYNIQKYDLEYIINLYSNILIFDKYISDHIKIIHSRFRNIDMSYNISKNLYVEVNNSNNNFTLNRSIYFQVLKHLLRCKDIVNKFDYEIVDTIFEELETFFIDDRLDIREKMEIADIFINYGKIIRGNEMLNIVRRQQEIIYINNNIINNINNNNVIYNDSQNVHDTSINESVKKACRELINSVDNIRVIFKHIKEEIEKMNEKNEEELMILIKDLINEKDKKFIYDLLYIEESEHDYYKIFNTYDFLDKEIDLEIVEKELCSGKTDIEHIINVIKRIEIETTYFDTFSLYQLFQSLWKFIILHKNSKDLKERLIEEMVEMDGYCTTGHLSRLINTIQGFTNIQKLHIKISDKEQIKSSVTIYLSKKLEDAPEEVLDNMLDEDKSIFGKYVLNIINKNFENFYKDYNDDFIKHIVDILKEYIRIDTIKLVNRILILE